MGLKFLVLANEPRLEEIVQGAPPLHLGDAHAAVEVVDSVLTYVSREGADCVPRSASIASGGVAVLDVSIGRKLARFQEMHGVARTGQCDRATVLKLDQLAVLKAERQALRCGLFREAPGTPALAVCHDAGPLIAPRSATQTVSARIRSLETRDGFDDTVSPPYQMLPVGGVRELELVGAEIDWRRVRVTTSNALAVHVERRRTLADRLRLTMRGNSAVSSPTLVRAQLDGRLVAEVEVAVKLKKQVRVDVVLLRSAEFAIQAATRREGLREVIAGVNEILQPQANVEVVLGRVGEQTVRRAGNLQSKLDFAAMRSRSDPAAVLTFFFAWASDDAWGTQLGDKIVVNGECESRLALASTIALEVGRFLGLERSVDGAALLTSSGNERHDNRLAKAQIETINP